MYSMHKGTASVGLSVSSPRLRDAVGLLERLGAGRLQGPRQRQVMGQLLGKRRHVSKNLQHTSHT